MLWAIGREGSKYDVMHPLTDLYTLFQNEALYVLVMIGYIVGINSGPNA